MTRGGWIVIVGLVSLLGVGSFALMRMLESETANATAESLDAPSGVAAKSSTGAELESAADAPAKTTAREAPKSETGASDVVDDSELADALWVEGRVVFPHETPLDEELWVVAQGRKFEKRPMHRTKVGADGRFRVAFAAKTKKGALALDAHYLYLKEPVSVTASVPPAELVLEPLVGGRIRGVCRVPLGRDDLAERARGSDVRGFGQGDSGSVRAQHQNRASKLDRELRFDLGGLDPALEFHVSVTPKEMVEVSRNDLDVQAGKVLELEFELCEGARASGVVVDEHGAAVGGARLILEQGHHTAWGRQSTQKDGTFSLTGIERGQLRLKVTALGYVETEHDLGLLDDGDVRSDLRIVLGRGLSIRGRAKWPDGSPAVGAFVNAESEERNGFGFSMEGKLGTAADGTFEITGLRKGKHKVSAHARRTADAAAAQPESPSAGETKAAPARASKPRVRGPTWRAELAGVEAGSSNVVLLLQSGQTLAGVVVDTSGAAVEAFMLEAKPAGDEHDFGRQLQLRQNKSFKSPEGRFELEGLVEGEWELRADAKGLRSEPVRVTLPLSGREPTLVVPIACELRGLVRDAAGNPAAGARVERVETQETSGIPFPSMGSNRKGTDWVQAGADGTFTFERVPAGTTRLVASGDAAAPSLPVDVEVLVGEAAHVELLLRVGGTIRGVVFAGDGRPDANRLVHARNEHDVGGGRQATSDESGRFVLAHLAPGQWHVQPNPNEAEIRGSLGSEIWETLQTRARNVTLADGQTVDLQLGGLEKDSITVRGRVTLGGKALSDVRVSGREVNGTEGNELRSANARADEGGSYDLVLPRPGTWQLTFESASGSSLTRLVEIPAGSTFRYDADFPLGVLRGRVVDRDGRALTEAWVSASPQEWTAHDAGALSSAQAQSGEDGRFRFEGLTPASYQLFVHSGWSWGATQRYGALAKPGCVVPEKGESDEYVLVLDRAGTLDVSVTGLDGKPLAGAGVTAQPIDAPLDRAPGHGQTASGGRTTIDGLAPGAYLVHAVFGDGVTLEPRRVLVSSGEGGEVELALAHGGALVVTAEDADGKKVAGWCSVVDERGLDHAWLVNPGLEEATSGDARPVRYAPLPPGRYRLRSKNQDGVEASAEAVVASGATARVTLRYGAPR